MATCFRCGIVDKKLPEYDNWDCLTCFIEEVNSDRENKDYEALEIQIEIMIQTQRRINSEVIDRKLQLALAVAKEPI
jgi:hypothetical protein